MKPILNTDSLPYCKGCGHELIAKNSARALERAGFSPLDVIIVTDIGCHGIIDKCLNTHTVHGLHGRSVALGAGIAFGTENAGKKIIVFIGDGGSTIGLQHILEAARLNLEMTVVVHNNMLYGMTGGQSSGLTPPGFRTVTSPGGSPWTGYDICALSHSAGASLVSRIAGVGDISGTLQEAFTVKGFSLVEVIEICPGYGMKFNPKRKLHEIMESSGRQPGRWENSRAVLQPETGGKTGDLLNELTPVSHEPDLPPARAVKLLVAGSAGEGVQLAAGLLASAAVRSGCHVTRRGSYPVTVGVGFSAAELVISPDPVGYHGIEVADAMIITSADGLAYGRKMARKMDGGILFIDSGLELPETGAEIHRHDFRSAGARYACLYAMLVFAANTGIVSAEAIFRSIAAEGLEEQIPVDRLKKMIDP